MCILRLVKLFSIFSLIALSGCKIEFDVPKGGKLIHQDGVDFCLEDSACVVEVNDTLFDETYVAIPDEGFAFMGWKKKDGALCQGHDKPCWLTTAFHGDFPELMAVLESDATYYLEPDFQEIVQGTDCESMPDSIPIKFDDFFADNPDIATTGCYYFKSGSNGLSFDFATLVIESGEIKYNLFTPGYDDVFGEGESDIGSGDVIFGFEINDNMADREPPVPGKDISISLYIDADGDKQTGMQMNGVLGADFRFDIASDCKKEFEPGSGYTQLRSPIAKWDSETSSWLLWVDDFDDDGKVSTAPGLVVWLRPIGNPTYAFFASFYSSAESLGVTNPPLAVVRVERYRAKCEKPGKAKVFDTSPVFVFDSYAQ